MDAKLIGEGVSARVYQYVHNNKSYAVKHYKNTKVTDLSWVIEASFLKHFKQRFFPEFINCRISSNGKPKLYMPQLTPLLEYNLKTMSDSVKQLVIRDIVIALSIMHYHGIMHTDAKPENILIVTEGTVVTGAVLADFGLIIATDFERLILPNRIVERAISVGSNKYITHKNVYPVCSRPPEVIQGNQISCLSDLWQLGITIISITNPDVRGFNLVKKGEKIRNFTQKDMDNLLSPYHIQNADVKKLCDGLLKVSDRNRSISDAFDPDEKEGQIQPEYADVNVTKYYNAIAASAGFASPLEVIKSIISSAVSFKKTANYILKCLDKWNTISTFSKDCILFFLHLLFKYARLARNTVEKLHGTFDSYVHFMILFNITLQLFHPEITIRLEDINEILQPDDMLTPTSYNKAVFGILQAFDFDIFATC